jgi:COMPASS component SWD3
MYEINDKLSIKDIHEDSVWCSSWNNKKNFILTGSVDSYVKIWNGENMKQISKISGHRLGVLSVDTDRDGNIGVSSSMDGLIRIFDIEKVKTLKTSIFL